MDNYEENNQNKIHAIRPFRVLYIKNMSGGSN